ncbi:hypothetical protein ACFS6H_14940 [Terrimonas rubra]|uniref:Uncharacterized protein n=1 Tax=Terrimonas rubra TaxID=1035890 RepID=A0ABW6A6M6_9BACT
MKNKNFLIILVFVCITAGLVSCNDGANIVKVDKKEYDALKSAADKWKEVDLLAAELVNRKAAEQGGENAMIDTASGDTYMLNYKTSKTAPPRHSAGVDFDKEAVAFMIKYMLDNKVENVRAAFGIYSNTAAIGKDGFATILFGLPKKISHEEWEKNPNATAIYPFKYKKVGNDNDTTPPSGGFLNWGDVVP